MRGDEAGTIYYVLYNWVMKVDTAGVVTRSQTPKIADDFRVDRSGNIYLCACFDHRIYKIEPGGKMSTVAGNGNEYGSGDQRWFSGDGGPAVDATLHNPWSIAVDSAGNLYIADSGNRRIRKVDPSGIITTIAGGGYLSIKSAEGGPATAASLGNPAAIWVDRAGNVFVLDQRLGRIFMLYR